MLTIILSLFKNIMNVYLIMSLYEYGYYGICIYIVYKMLPLLYMYILQNIITIYMLTIILSLYKYIINVYLIISSYEFGYHGICLYIVYKNTTSIINVHFIKYYRYIYVNDNIITFQEYNECISNYVVI